MPEEIQSCILSLKKLLVPNQLKYSQRPNEVIDSILFGVDVRSHLAQFFIRRTENPARNAFRSLPDNYALGFMNSSCETMSPQFRTTYLVLRIQDNPRA